MKRLAIFLVVTFAISWGDWWILTSLVPPGGSLFSSRLHTTIFLLGGFGPTIGGLVAVALTPRDGDLAEYGERLFRWRVSPIWWLALLAIPIVFAAGKEWIAVWAGGGGVRPDDMAPLRRIVTLFPTMIIGGGLEELGWRGVAQPAVERRAPRLAAALIVGVVWALWHLPLFQIPGASQFGRNFPLFAADVVANACLLAWVYAGTRSILFCVLFHALSNTATAMGFVAIGVPGPAAWIAVSVKLACAIGLLMMAPRRLEAQPATA